jgi:hypothetical protein
LVFGETMAAKSLNHLFKQIELIRSLQKITIRWISTSSKC